MIDIFVVEGTVAYTLHNGKVLDPIPICSVYQVNQNNLIIDYKAYMDLNPLFIAIGNDITADENGRPKIIPRQSKTSSCIIA